MEVLGMVLHFLGERKRSYEVVTFYIGVCE